MSVATTIDGWGLEIPLNFLSLTSSTRHEKPISHQTTIVSLVTQVNPVEGLTTYEYMTVLHSQGSAEPFGGAM
jgi:hypothetical protein